MKTRIRTRRKTARRAPKVRRCGCAGRAQTDAKSRLNETRDSGLMIGGARDPAEMKAETAARSVMAGGSAPVAHRMCADCATGEKDDKTAHREASSGGTAPGKASAPASASVESAVSSMGEGRTLSDGERSFFEPRFGRDFSDVRIHEDAAADRAAKGMDATAFTVGTDIAMAKGEYEREGPSLMAHELAHVADEGDRTARRTVRGNSTCPTSVPGTPSDPLARIAELESLAINMSMGAATLMQFATEELSTPFFGVNDVVMKFREVFGAPVQQVDARFPARLAGGDFISSNEATAAEMRAVAGRYERIGAWFNRSIRYRCPNLARFTIPGCTRQNCGTQAAWTCPTGTRHIALCNAFWSISDEKVQASLLVHEAHHAALRLRGHSTDHDRRLNNPACNGSFIRKIFGITGLSAPQCPPP